MGFASADGEKVDPLARASWKSGAGSPDGPDGSSWLSGAAESAVAPDPDVAVAPWPSSFPAAVSSDVVSPAAWPEGEAVAAGALSVPPGSAPAPQADTTTTKTASGMKSRDRVAIGRHDTRRLGLTMRGTVPFTVCSQQAMQRPWHDRALPWRLRNRPIEQQDPSLRGTRTQDRQPRSPERR